MDVNSIIANICKCIVLNDGVRTKSTYCNASVINVSYSGIFDDSTDDQILLDILDDMGLTGWYNNLEKGLDTIIMDGSMSAGEAQLLAFSRIFLRDPKIVILDEATSRLDPATEGLIEKAVEKLLENRTAILIAHRLETLSKLDNIMILDSGSITEFGNQQELLNDPKSEYSRLLKLGIEEVLI